MEHIQTIKVPADIQDNFGMAIEVLIVMTAGIQAAPPTTAIFDFTDCVFASPLVLGTIAILSKRLKEEGVKVEFKFDGKNHSLQGYLSTIYFPEGFTGKDAGNSTDQLIQRYSSKTYVPLFSFPAGKTTQENEIREAMISALGNIIRNQLKLDGPLWSAIQYLIVELSNNISDHSGAREGIVLAQYYPTKHFMDICIADSGRGLLRSYLDSGKHAPKSDTEAIQLAVFGNSTKELPDSRGFGISTSRKLLVNGLGGKFCLVSGGAFFTQTTDKEDIIDISGVTRYRGCYVALRIPTASNQQFDIYKYIGN